VIFAIILENYATNQFRCLITRSDTPNAARKHRAFLNKRRTIGHAT
jgi:hypothetical protein